MSDQKNIVEVFAQSLGITIVDQGKGQAILLLHGGAGPATMIGLATALSKNARTIVPTHPGFNGEPRPEWFNRAQDLALAYLALIEKLDLKQVIVIGNSFGGWVACEMALRHSPRIAGIVLLNAVGTDTGSPDKKIVDPMLVPATDRAALSFHDPARFAITPSGPQMAIMAENQRNMRVYAGEILHDPGLRSRLVNIKLPALVAWGVSDKIVGLDYGELLADSIPKAQFAKIDQAGHFPQIERLEEVTRLITQFQTALPKNVG